MAGWPGYKLNDFGQIFSCRRGRRWRPLSIHVGRRGYKVWLHKDGGIEKAHVLLSKLMARSFLGEPPAGTRLFFMDGDPSNHCLANLAYMTREEAVRMGIVADVRRGEAAPTAKLTTEDVIEIRRANHAGERIASIARRKGISHPLCWQIVFQKIWKHIDAGVPPPDGRQPRYVPKHQVLTDEQIRDIRRMAATGMRACDIHRVYPEVGYSAVNAHVRKERKRCGIVPRRSSTTGASTTRPPRSSRSSPPGPTTPPSSTPAAGG